MGDFRLYRERYKLARVNETPDGTVSFVWQNEEEAKDFYAYVVEELNKAGQCHVLTDESNYVKPVNERYYFCGGDPLCLSQEGKAVFLKNLTHGPAEEIAQ